MDELKLIRWKGRFEKEAKNIQVEFSSFFLKRKLEDFYEIILNESNQWELKIEDNLPNEIKSRLQRSFLSAKPEDSI